jgi:hypothetical protein
LTFSRWGCDSDIVTDIGRYAIALMNLLQGVDSEPAGAYNSAIEQPWAADPFRSPRQARIKLPRRFQETVDHEPNTTHCRCPLPKRPLTPGYVIFYILFWPDTWRILIGIALAAILVPLMLSPDMGAFVSVLLFVMVATIGYSLAALPARGITSILKKLILGNRRP